MNVRHSIGVLHLFSIKNIYRKIYKGFFILMRRYIVVIMPLKSPEFLILPVLTIPRQ